MTRVVNVQTRYTVYDSGSAGLDSSRHSKIILITYNWMQWASIQAEGVMVPII